MDILIKDKKHETKEFLTEFLEFYKAHHYHSDNINMDEYLIERFVEFKESENGLDKCG